MIDTFTVRCSILRLAFSGKLTEQIETEGTAADLLVRINSKKNIAQSDNTPYEIPTSWAWARIADIYKINPKVEADSTTNAAFIPMERISAGFDRKFTFEVQNWGRASKNHTKFANGDVAFAKITPCFENRKSFIAHSLPNGIGGGTTELIILRQNEMLPEYTYYILLDQRFINTGVSSYKGTVGQQRVQSDVVKNYLVPVAPYLEQKRIVEKIDQAFSVLDTIDALQAQYANNLTTLKAKLIDAAIQGKLTEQLPEDGTAEELYQQIQVKKDDLIKSKSIKKDKEVRPIGDNLKISIPQTWRLCKLGCLAKIITDGEHKTPSRVNEYCGYYLLSARNIRDGYISLKNVDYVSENEFNRIARRCNPKCGDVLISCSGSVGRCAVVEDDNQYVMVRSAAMVSPLFINSKFLMYAIQSKYVQLQIQDSVKQTLQANLFQDAIRNLVIPLPPLKEQKRIVETLDCLVSTIEP